MSKDNFPKKSHGILHKVMASLSLHFYSLPPFLYNLINKLPINLN
jgi:hypothetical protein